MLVIWNLFLVIYQHIWGKCRRSWHFCLVFVVIVPFRRLYKRFWSYELAQSFISLCSASMFHSCLATFISKSFCVEKKMITLEWTVKELYNSVILHIPSAIALTAMCFQPYISMVQCSQCNSINSLYFPEPCLFEGPTFQGHEVPRSQFSHLGILLLGNMLANID